MIGKARLSKIETLKVACNYIAALTESLEKGEQLTSAALCLRLSCGVTPLKGHRILKKFVQHTEVLNVFNANLSIYRPK